MAETASGRWSVYLVLCADGTLYCGVTTDVRRRLDEHNGLLAGGAKYTRSRRPVRLVAFTGGLERAQALRLERTVKKLPREKKPLALSCGCEICPGTERLCPVSAHLTTKSGGNML